MYHLIAREGLMKRCLIVGRFSSNCKFSTWMKSGPTSSRSPFAHCKQPVCLMRAERTALSQSHPGHGMIMCLINRSDDSVLLRECMKTTQFELHSLISIIAVFSTACRQIRSFPDWRERSALARMIALRAESAKHELCMPLSSLSELSLWCRATSRGDHSSISMFSRYGYGHSACWFVRLNSIWIGMHSRLRRAAMH